MRAGQQQQESECHEQLSDMQCLWYFYEKGAAHMRLHEWALSHKSLRLVDKARAPRESTGKDQGRGARQGTGRAGERNLYERER